MTSRIDDEDRRRRFATLAQIDVEPDYFTTNAGRLSGASRGVVRIRDLERIEWIRDLERTFGFGYQLLRSCAVDGYELPYFQQHVEKKWEALFNDAHSSAKALNELDGEQKHTGDRLSLYPEDLTFEQKMTFRARRNLIEGERQREDLKIYAGEGMHLLQSALLPFAYGNADAWVSPVGSMLDRRNELVEDLKKAAKSQSLSPKAKAVAEHAAWIVSTVAEAGKPFTYPVSPTDVAAREVAAMESSAGNACVRLFAWARRHQVLSRMARLNLDVRLKVLADDGPLVGGGLTGEDLIEREMPTAVGPFAGKSGSRLALGSNQKYTNLFYLLRDNTKKQLHEIPPVKWEDFDTWAKRHPEFVRRTPWDKEYVPPWDRPNGALARNSRQSWIVRILLASKSCNGLQLLLVRLAEF
eukprot:g7607.t1